MYRQRFDNVFKKEYFIHHCIDTLATNNLLNNLFLERNLFADLLLEYFCVNTGKFLNLYLICTFDGDLYFLEPH